ncbi:MAG TPA: type II toxin-antitoxin system PemK/MazF family toxin [Bryobacteraceae bacterium]|nr:type II toxin-antitoxin system PemK/MazF family toxin [Bryobacteraceae bacterium]
MAKTTRRPPGQKQKVIPLLRGDVYLCSLDPTIGHEMKKTRPALVIQNDVGNRYSSVTIVAAITSTLSPVPYPVEVVVDASTTNGLGVRSSIRLDQIRSVDRQRLIRRLGVLDSTTMAKVDEAIKISLGLVRL